MGTEKGPLSFPKEGSMAVGLEGRVGECQAGKHSRTGPKLQL